METKQQENQFTERHNAQTIELADLPLTDSQAESATGGTETVVRPGEFPWQVSMQR